MKKKQWGRRKLIEGWLSEEVVFSRLFRAIELVPAQVITVEETLQTCLQLICEATGWSAAHARILTHTDFFEGHLPTDIWHVTPVEGGKELRKSIESKQLFLPTIWGDTTLVTGRPFVIPEIAQEGSFAADVLTALGLKSVLGTPVSAGKKLKAIVEFFSLSPIDNHVLWEEILASLSTIIASVIERKWLEQAFRDMRAKLVNIQEQERRRLARELHDTTGQSISMIIINLESLESEIQMLPPMARHKVAETRDLARKSLQELRTLSYVLHPPLLDELGVTAALQAFAEGFSDRTGIHVDLDLPDQCACMPRDLEVTIFHVVQESLSNVFKHSHSPNAKVRMRLDQGRVAIQVQDEGTGVQLSQTRPFPKRAGVGIASMEERVKQFGGELRFANSNHGTQVEVTLPVPEMAHAAGA